MSTWQQRLAAGAASRVAASRVRVRREIAGGHGVVQVVDGRPFINFCGNDYLGLATHPSLAAAAHGAADDGWGSGASALVSGYNRHHRVLEDALAEWLGAERALLFSSGFAANVGVLRGLLQRGDVLIADDLNHASLIDGGRLSGADYRRVPHACAASWQAAIAEAPSASGGLKLAVTDSVFSMDGDIAPLSAIADAARAHDAALLVDDAHGFGVLGGGRGVLWDAEVMGDNTGCDANTLYMTGFGKALGSSGAVVVGGAAWIDALLHGARSYVFSTAPPPPMAAATLAALRVVQSDDGAERRAQLHANIAQFTSGAAQRGIALMPSRTPIQPLVLGNEPRTMAVSQALREAGYWVAGIRPPTVAAGTSRLRISLSAAHAPQQIEGLLDAMAAALGNHPVEEG